ncbi:MAG: tRNA (adenosine(37)-N6)-threonylcarbamoyltransferase complex dimerization subunit type 1 TsaB [Pirellula sp.]
MAIDTILLALETSGKSGSVALLKSLQGCTQCDLELLESGSGSAKTLAPAIARLLSRASVAPQQLTAIALITGPGSFTGLRVGVSTAKAMAYALKIPTVEIDTLDVIASQTASSVPILDVVLDAYRGQVFHSRYAFDLPSNLYRKVTETRIVDIDQLLLDAFVNTDQHPKECQPDASARDKASARDVGQIVFCGPGCGRIRSRLDDADFGESGLSGMNLDRIHWLENHTSSPRADTVALLAFPKVRAGDLVDAFHLNPRYYRNSAAEEKLRKL